MNEQIQIHIGKYSAGVIDLFTTLRQLIFDSITVGLTETLWAKIPSYYVGESFARLIPYKDHINIEAQVAIHHKAELTGYKIIPKGMVQIYTKQDVPIEVLRQIFKETLI